MNHIATLEGFKISDYIKNYYTCLTTEKYLVEKRFDWINLEIRKEVLFGKGSLNVGENIYQIELQYSPFYYGESKRFDKIYIKNQRFIFSNKIHVYRDLSLCLYHPIMDMPFLQVIPLYKMIPWITEWCIHYEEYKKYGVWFGEDIKH